MVLISWAAPIITPVLLAGYLAALFAPLYFKLQARGVSQKAALVLLVVTTSAQAEDADLKQTWYPIQEICDSLHAVGFADIRCLDKNGNCHDGEGVNKVYFFSVKPDG